MGVVEQHLHDPGPVPLRHDAARVREIGLAKRLRKPPVVLVIIALQEASTDDLPFSLCRWRLWRAESGGADPFSRLPRAGIWAQLGSCRVDPLFVSHGMHNRHWQGQKRAMA